MGFFKDVALNLANNKHIATLYDELPDFQAAISYVSSERKALLYEHVIDFLSKAIQQVNQLTREQKVTAGIMMYQGQIFRLRSGVEKEDAFAKWVLGAYLVSQNTTLSEKQTAIYNATKAIIDTAKNLHNPF